MCGKSKFKHSMTMHAYRYTPVTNYIKVQQCQFIISTHYFPCLSTICLHGTLHDTLKQLSYSAMSFYILTIIIAYLMHETTCLDKYYDDCPSVGDLQSYVCICNTIVVLHSGSWFLFLLSFIMLHNIMCTRSRASHNNREMFAELIVLASLQQPNLHTHQILLCQLNSTCLDWIEVHIHKVQIV